MTTLTVAQASEQFGVSKELLRSAIHDGNIRSERRGRSRLIDVASLQKYLSRPTDLKTYDDGLRVSILRACELFGFSRNRWAALARAGTIPAKRLRARRTNVVWLLDKEAAREYVNQLTLPPGHITGEEAARRLGVAPTTVRQLISLKKLRGERHAGAHGPTWAVEEKSVREYAASRQQHTLVVNPLEYERLRPSWRLWLEGKGCTPTTLRGYDTSVSLFARWSNAGGLSLMAVGQADIARWLTGNNWARATRNNRTLSLRSFFGYCVEQGHCQADPTVGLKIVRRTPTPKQPFSDDELQALVRAATTPRPRDKALMLMAMGTGARREELASIRAEDVNWERGAIFMRKTKGDRPRWVAPGPAAMEALQAYLGGRTGHIWVTAEGKPMDGRGLYRLLTKLGRQAGVEGVYVHRFRVTMANRWLDKGGDLVALQSAMGHADVTMTAHYGRFNAAQRGLELQATMLDGLVPGAPTLPGLGQKSDSVSLIASERPSVNGNGERPDVTKERHASRAVRQHNGRPRKWVSNATRTYPRRRLRVRRRELVK